MANKIRIPVILGPTASGKTSAGLELARLLNGEIISVDSRKVYRGLPIGTATPPGMWTGPAYVVQGIAHHLMAHLNPDRIYTAGDFAQDADTLISDILSRGKKPLLVGGTGFYFKALQKGLPQLPPRDPALRQELAARMDAEGRDELHKELAGVDPVAARSISRNDPHKIIRALEIYQLTGQPFSNWKGAPPKETPYEFIVMGLYVPPTLLENHIVARSRTMVERGMIQETRAVIEAGYAKTCAALSSFGFKEAVQVVDGLLPEADFLPRLIKGTKSYAKRQRTWFRTQVQPTWFECGASTTPSETARRMKAFLDRPN